MDKIEKLKKFLQEHYPNIQAFNTRNIVRDYMVKIIYKLIIAMTTDILKYLD